MDYKKDDKDLNYLDKKMPQKKYGSFMIIIIGAVILFAILIIGLMS